MQSVPLRYMPRGCDRGGQFGKAALEGANQATGNATQLLARSTSIHMTPRPDSRFRTRLLIGERNLLDPHSLQRFERSAAIERSPGLPSEALINVKTPAQLPASRRNVNPLRPPHPDKRLATQLPRGNPLANPRPMNARETRKFRFADNLFHPGTVSRYRRIVETLDAVTLWVVTTLARPPWDCISVGSTLML